jgi:signal transduction histidine kinase
VYADTVQEIAREIVTLHGEEAIAGRVLERLGLTLGLTWAWLSFLPDADLRRRFVWGKMPANAAAAHTEALIADGVKIGWLKVGTKRGEAELHQQDRALIRTLAPLVATALQSAAREQHLERQVHLLHQRENELVALSDLLMRVQEDERHHLSLDLHDDPLQRAMLLARELGEQAEHDPRAKAWRGDIDEIIASLRAICAGLRPRVLDDLGLEAGMSWLVTNFRARTELDVALNVWGVDGEAFGRLTPELEIALFRVAQEALANCLRHADAQHVTVHLQRENGNVRLQVHDDGIGYRVQPSADATAMLGILGMRERLRAWGGTVLIEALEPRGTRVVAEVGSR